MNGSYRTNLDSNSNSSNSSTLTYGTMDRKASINQVFQADPTILNYNKPEPVKIKRTRASNEQLQILETFYSANATPTPKERKGLAESLDMPQKSVWIWFQNRRAKDKRKLNGKLQSNSCDGNGRKLTFSNFNSYNLNMKRNFTFPLNFNLYENSTPINNNLFDINGLVEQQFQTNSLNTTDTITTPTSTATKFTNLSPSLTNTYNPNYNFNYNFHLNPLPNLMESDVIDLEDIKMNCHTLKIGSWQRVSILEQDLQLLTCKRDTSINWLVSNMNLNFKIKLKLQSVIRINLIALDINTCNAEVESNEESDINLKLGELQLDINQLPTYSTKIFDLKTNLFSWYPCLDFTENCQASNNFTHKIQATFTNLKLLLEKLILQFPILKDMVYVNGISYNQLMESNNTELMQLQPLPQPPTTYYHPNQPEEYNYENLNVDDSSLDKIKFRSLSLPILPKFSNSIPNLYNDKLPFPHTDPTATNLNVNEPIHSPFLNYMENFNLVLETNFNNYFSHNNGNNGLFSQFSNELRVVSQNASNSTELGTSYYINEVNENCNTYDGNSNGSDGNHNNEEEEEERRNDMEEGEEDGHSTTN